MTSGDPVQAPALRPPRPGWLDAPARLRDGVEKWLGSRVVAAISQPGGFSPGIAARLATADGRRVFVKAVGPQPNAFSPELHRRELATVPALQDFAPVPRLLWSHDEGPGGWVALAFEDIAGGTPAIPWDPRDLDRVLAAMGDLAEALTPSPVHAVPHVSDWSVLVTGYWRLLAKSPPDGLDDWSRRNAAALVPLEDHAPLAASGESLLHLDLRSDNLLLDDNRVWFVDWAHARIGAPWVDLLYFSPGVELEGGPPPEELLAGNRLLAVAPDDDVTAVVAAIAGFFTWGALQPPVPGLPTVRAFMGAQGDVARRWLARRAGLA
jgi:aminoglycoside phosphotransferase (APT) family kinase protein